MSSEWDAFLLGDLIELKHGWAFKGRHFCDPTRDLPVVVKPGNFREEGGLNFEYGRTQAYNGEYPIEYELEPGDLLVVMTCQTRGGEILGVPGIVPYGPTRYLHNQRLGRVTIRDEMRLDEGFLYWLLADWGVRRQLVGGATGSTVLHTSPARIKEVRVRVPALHEQRRIAWVLGSLDDKIELNRQLARTLEEIAAALFEARFVDYVGVEEFEESEIGPIPKGWVVVPFSDAVEINPSVDLKKGQDAPYVEMAAVPAWGTRPSAVGHRPYKGGARFEHGDTLMARITGCIEHGKGAFADFIDGPTSGSTEFLVLRATEALSPEAVFLLSRTDRVREHAIANMSGSSGRQRVPTSCFRNLPVALPPSRADWSNLAQLLTANMRRTYAIWCENQTLTALRDALLPKLISGEIRVPEGFGPEDADEGADKLAGDTKSELPATQATAAAT